MKNRYSANDPEITRILANCRTVYLICHWAQYGYLPLPFSGEFILTPITKTTTGYVIDWTFDEEEAKRKIAELNEGKVQL